MRMNVYSKILKFKYLENIYSKIYSKIRRFFFYRSYYLHWWYHNLLNKNFVFILVLNKKAIWPKNNFRTTKHLRIFDAGIFAHKPWHWGWRLLKNDPYNRKTLFAARNVFFSRQNISFSAKNVYMIYEK